MEEQAAREGLFCLDEEKLNLRNLRTDSSDKNLREPGTVRIILLANPKHFLTGSSAE